MEDTINFSPTEFREKILNDLEIRKNDIIILVCAILIASIGLNLNSTAVVIGAMLISPVMAPILGIGYGLSVLDLLVVKKSTYLLFLEVSISLIVAFLYFAISPISYASSEIIARTSPTIWDVVIAFSGGVAGIIGTRKKNTNNIVPGVAIATALMPPMCTVGYSLATLNWNYLLGSAYLFIINCAFIVIATFIGIRVMRFPLQTKAKANETRKINYLLLIIALLIIFPSIISATSLVKDSVRKSAITQLLNNEFSDYIILSQDYNKSQNVLTLTISGQSLEEVDITNIEKKMPDYGLKQTKLSIIQIPKLTDLDDSELAKYLNKYIQNKLEQGTDKNVEQKKEDSQTATFDSED
jgi:uncharacterized hydrophobic protein (TIGR00271 family)